MANQDVLEALCAIKLGTYRVPLKRRWWQLRERYAFITVGRSEASGTSWFMVNKSRLVGISLTRVPWEQLTDFGPIREAKVFVISKGHMLSTTWSLRRSVTPFPDDFADWLLARLQHRVECP